MTVRCRLVALAARLGPLAPVAGRRWLAHAERCPRCAASAAGREESRGFVVRTGDIPSGAPDAMWRSVRRRIADGPDPGRARAAAVRPAAFAWARTAFVAAALVVAGAAAFWTVRGLTPAADEGAGIRIESLHAGGAPATPIIVRPAGSGMTVVWAASKVD